jgi:peroxiredoxin
LQGRLTELRAQGLGLAAISYDPVETLAAFSEQRGITFPLLSDAGSETIKRYGILNTVVDDALGPHKDDPAVKEETQKYVSAVGVNPIMKGIAFPGTFIVDRRGRVTSRFFEDFYVERNTTSSLLVRAGVHGASVEATKVSGAHLDLTTYLSDAAVAAGNRFSLVLDIKPGAGIHVYDARARTRDSTSPDPDHDPLRGRSGVALRRISTPSPDPIPHSIPIVPSTAQFNEFYR